MIVLLSPYKFTKFHYLIYEIDIFKKKINEKIEIHDLSKITNPYSETTFKLPRYKNTKIFKNINQWESHFKKINQKNKLIVFNLLELNSFSSLRIHFKLSKYVNTLIQLKSQGLPNIFIKKNKSVNTSLILNKFFKVLQNKSQIYLFLKKKIIISLVRFIKFEEIYYLKLGKKKNFFTELNSKRQIYVDYHSHDFSRMNYLTKKKENKKIGIFLDTPEPYSLDDYSILGTKINYDVKKWYKDLNIFLKKAEKIFNCKIIIIPHPKVKNINNPYYSKHFQVNRDLDAVHKLIPLSKIVFSISASTSIGIAAACGKKTVLIYNDQIKNKNIQLFDSCKWIAKKSKSTFLNINKFDSKNIKKIKGNKKNNNYIYNYMTSKKISKKENYEIFNNLVKKIKYKKYYESKL